jgi:hypothetical protein
VLSYARNPPLATIIGRSAGAFTATSMITDSSCRFSDGGCIDLYQCSPICCRRLFKVFEAWQAGLAEIQAGSGLQENVSSMPAAFR